MQSNALSQRILAPPYTAESRDLGAFSALGNDKLLQYFVPHLLQSDLDTFESFTTTCRRARLLGLAFAQQQIHDVQRKLSAPGLVFPDDEAALARRRNVRKVGQAFAAFHRRTAPNTLALLAARELRACRDASAERAADIALRLRPDCMLALLTKAEVCIRAPEREREARHLLVRAHKAQPESTAPLLRLSRWKLATNEPGRAMPPLYAALDAQPDSVDVPRNLAMALYRLGQRDIAQQHWSTARELELAQLAGDGGARAARERTRQAQRREAARRMVGQG